MAWSPCLAWLPVFLLELTNREARGLSCVMGQRGSHPGKQGQWGPTPSLYPARHLLCWPPEAPKGLRCVWLSPPLSATTTS